MEKATLWGGICVCIHAKIPAPIGDNCSSSQGKAVGSVDGFLYGSFHAFFKFFASIFFKYRSFSLKMQPQYF